VLEVQISANEMAIKTVNAALMRFEFGRMATTNFLRFIDLDLRHGCSLFISTHLSVTTARTCSQGHDSSSEQQQ
jgi:hypothetical protein